MSENNPLSDQELFEAIRQGDSSALTLLFQRYYQQICRFIFLFVPDNELTEELSANVFIRLWENRRKIMIQHTLRSYLYQSAKNQAFSYLRKKKPSLQLWSEGLEIADEKDQSPEAIYIETELNNEFVRAFQKLPARAQLAFKLHRFDGLTYREIGAIMEISVSAVEKNITSALKTLHRELIGHTKLR